MKTTRPYLLIAISISMVGMMVGCKDIAEVEKAATPAFPFQRTITDSKGRQLTATFLAKSGNKMALRRASDRKEFILTLDSLSEVDRTFLGSLQDGHQEKIPAIEKKLAKEARLSGRHASWHNDIENAKREAAKLDIPICLFFVRPLGNTNKAFDRDILKSPEFRQWANQNVVLCLYTFESTKVKGSGLNGISARESKKVASQYGVSGAPVAVILNPDGTKRSILAGYNDGNTQAYIKLLEPKL